MNRFILSFSLILFACAACRQNSGRSEQTPEKSAESRKAERFFGVHYDIHVQKGWKDMGKNVDTNQIARLLDEVKPDYVQIDCKGHPGYASYPTKIQESAENFIKNPLSIWRNETSKRNVGLYMHFSGVVDQWVVTRHPGWAALNADGHPYGSQTSIFSPYVDKYFIPQLKELIDDYRVDGVWIDGDSWGMTWDYNEMSLRKFREQTGITKVPKSYDDPGFQEFARFCREEYRKYADHYIRQLHAHAPEFRIINSGVYSARMPEFGSLNYDYLSVDEPTAQVRRSNISTREASTINFCRFDGRVFANQTIPWDIMIWGFYDRNFQTANQLKQSMAVINALGGGASVYYPQKRDGSIPDESIPILAELGRFCRPREPFCYQARSIPQIGLVMPSESVYRLLRKPFELDDNGELRFLKGLLFGLVESQQVVDILLMDPLFRINPGDYPLLVLADWEFLMDGQIKALLDYVSKGGNLLIIGPHAADYFRTALDIEWEGEPEERSNGIPVNGQIAEVTAFSRIPVPGPKAIPVMDFYPDFGQDVFHEGDYKSFRKMAASVAAYGEGKIGACFIDLGKGYYLFRSSYIRDILKSLVRDLFPNPMLEIEGSDYVDATLNSINGKTEIHLVNTSGPHAQRDVYIYDDISPVGPLSVTLRLDRKPARLVLQPGGEKIDFKFRNGMAKFTIDRLEMYDIIVVEQ